MDDDARMILVGDAANKVLPWWYRIFLKLLGHYTPRWMMRATGLVVVWYPEKIELVKRGRVVYTVKREPTRYYRF